MFTPSIDGVTSAIGILLASSGSKAPQGDPRTSARGTADPGARASPARDGEKTTVPAEAEPEISAARYDVPHAAGRGRQPQTGGRSRPT